MKIKTRRYDEKFTGKNAGNEVAEFQMLLKENVILREFNEFKGDYPFMEMMKQQESRKSQRKSYAKIINICPQKYIYIYM